MGERNNFKGDDRFSLVSMKPRVLFADVTFETAKLQKEPKYLELLSLAETRYTIPQSEAELCDVIRDVEIAIVGDSPITPRVLDAAPKLKLVAKCGVGFDNIDVEYATRKRVLVTNVPGVLAGPVAEHTLLLMLAVARKLVSADSYVRTERWDAFRSLGAGFDLRGKTLGVIGFGAIGRRVAEMARTAFGMQILAFDPLVPPEKIRNSAGEPATLEQLLGESDIVSVHVPLMPATTGLVGEKELRRMKPSAVLINTSRGRVLDEKALEKALTSGWIAAAGLDVLEKEPPDPGSLLLKLPNVTMTPHTAAFTAEATRALWLACIGASIDVLKGERPRSPANVLNPTAMVVEK